MLRLLSLTAIIALASAGNVTFTDCAMKELTSIDVTGCMATTCSVKTGSTVTITSTFVANQDSAKATIALQAQLGELKVMLPLADTDGCKVISPMCPIKKGTTYTTKLVETVENLQAGTKPIITGTLTGDKGVLFCGSVPLTVA